MVRIFPAAAFYSDVLPAGCPVAGTIGGLPAAALDASAVCRGKYFIFAGADKRRTPMDLYLSERRDER